MNSFSLYSIIWYDPQYFIIFRLSYLKEKKLKKYILFKFIKNKRDYILFKLTKF
jgi:hypothetical protein